METGTHDPRPHGSGTQHTTGEAKEKAKELGRTARERALSVVDQQKDQVSGLLDRVADSMQDDRIGGYASQYARRGAELLRRQSADELFDSMRRGLRARPGLVLSACFVAGLAFARLVKGTASGGPHDDGRWSERGYGERASAESSWPRRAEGTP
jgi:hypothetical protein